LQGLEVVTDDSPLAAHSATPAELQARVEAAREGRPFLVLRDDTGAQVLIDLGGDRERLSIGRTESNDISLAWDVEVSRLHAELERIAGRHRLRDGEVVRIGNTAIAYQRPAVTDAREETRVAAQPLTRDDLSAAQRRLLVAL